VATLFSRPFHGPGEFITAVSQHLSAGLLAVVRQAELFERSFLA
jgi:hypothetical protein